MKSPIHSRDGKTDRHKDHATTTITSLGIVPRLFHECWIRGLFALDALHRTAPRRNPSGVNEP